MRIALIAGTYAPDRCGVAHYTDRLRNALAQRGIESLVLTTFDAAPLANDPRVLDVVPAWHLRDLLPLVQAIHRTKTDILHIQHAAGTYGFDRAIFLLPLLLKLTGWHNPIITTVHEYGWWEWQPKWIPRSLLELLKIWGQRWSWWDREDGFLLTQSDATITTNHDAEQVLYDRLPHFKPRVHRIPIGANVEVAPIDRRGARQKIYQRCGWSEDATVIAFFGFLHPVKGLETLLVAFKQVSEQHPRARLLLIGGVESLALRGQEAQQYWEKLQQQSAALNLNDKIHMTGYLNAETASHALTGSDIGVLPFNHGVTLKSGSLLTLMAHGLPVIATQSNDFELKNSSLIQSIAPRNVDELTQAFLNLLPDITARHQLSESGRAFVHQFSWSSIAEAHLEIYRSVQPNLQRSVVTHA